jgi:exodeoxyribonuclease VII small subunit
MDNIEQLSYEVAYQQLEALIEQLEGGELSLEESVERYQQGQLLSAHCQKLLEDAELKIKQVDDTGEIR